MDEPKGYLPMKQPLCLTVNVILADVQEAEAAFKSVR